MRWRQPNVQGQVLGGRYRLEEQLGSGGMAVVWAATDEVLGRTVAVKMLNGAHTAKPESLRRMRAEARTAATLSHPNIAQVHDYGEATEDGGIIPYVVMELVPGPTLAQQIAAGPVEPRVAFRICAEIAAALTAAHAASLVHRDIKPANVIVTPTGAKVVDFGIAASTSPGSEGDLPEQVLGTPSYLAPERLTDDAVEPASDVYALGVILYKLIAGQLPWTVDSTTQVLTAHVYVPPEPLRPTPGVPEQVADLCHSCLRKDPALRPTAPQVAAVLAAAAGLQVVPSAPALAAAGPAVDGEPSALLVPRAPRRGRSRVRVLAAAGVGVVSVAAVLTWTAFGSPPGAEGKAGPASSPVASLPAAATSDPATPAPDAGASSAPGAGPTGAGMPGRTPGSDHSDAGSPGEAEPTTEEPTTDPPEPPTEEHTLTSIGGTVNAGCDSAGNAWILSWTVAEGFKLVKVEKGPATTVKISYKRSKEQVRMSVTCRNGVPAAVTTTVTG
ncbi:protein kinase [Dactylosporangium sp. NPDC005555]|uniref:serine/threonine-protein kinase n=1 Tax=Dactylosporangium sp. NPDC005555 TaxID=3154889 RepID=UPI0033AF9B7C